MLLFCKGGEGIIGFLPGNKLGHIPFEVPVAAVSDRGTRLHGSCVDVEFNGMWGKNLKQKFYGSIDGHSPRPITIF
ncbi:unnamed protein product [Pleuronectes platessa]|uniref:Uncharacterized protein n=1 Tax=Pleuronectes platessa TaxID=8262 RepID=A0A9N7ZBG6_PLEPL|nr:unnamed protein product [Pleuronectes platessa]